MSGSSLAEEEGGGSLAPPSSTNTWDFISAGLGSSVSLLEAPSYRPWEGSELLLRPYYEPGERLPSFESQFPSYEEEESSSSPSHQQQQQVSRKQSLENHPTLISALRGVNSKQAPVLVKEEEVEPGQVAAISSTESSEGPFKGLMPLNGGGHPHSSAPPSVPCLSTAGSSGSSGGGGGGGGGGGVTTPPQRTPPPAHPPHGDKRGKKKRENRGGGEGWPEKEK
eukprot:TRINITY_DN636_c0_g2_i1.p1 TRINITY_DN636_c0_g2~~TRINITY_DN636_c0_g2_i1.p1  ORF type:complete len:224 (+),score=70.05 TRINITY_DN636_c0_g2_i1:130-801(+)